MRLCYPTGEEADMTLAEGLRGLNEDEQGTLARKAAPAAPPKELIEALRIPRLGEWAQLHIVYELTHRSPSLADDIVHSLIAQPLGPGTEWLGEALVQIFQHEPSTRTQIVRALIDAGDAVLDAGGNTHEAGKFVAQIAECVKLVGALPEVREVTQLARRLLDTAASEADPYLFAVTAAKRLTGDAQ
ncbi:MAG: hypothetical protein ND866_31975 [Pyrinomonadaceae bacterium]|nr:hypothetical protein [Pyrinomonadaceae bacterium]